MAKRRRQAVQPAKKIDNGLVAIIGVGVVVVLLVGGLIMFNQSATTADVAPAIVDYPVGITEDGQPYKGAADAPVELVEFADFRCSHCGDFYQETKELNEDYIKTGQLKLVFKNFPVIGQPSITAAQAAECALAQGAEAFWVYHDTLFENQTTGDTLFSRSGLKGVAGASWLKYQ